MFWQKLLHENGRLTLSLHHKLVVLLGQVARRPFGIEEQRIDVADVLFGDVGATVHFARLECGSQQLHGVSGESNLC